MMKIEFLAKKVDLYLEILKDEKGAGVDLGFSLGRGEAAL